MKKWLKIAALVILALIAIPLLILILRPSQLVAKSEARQLFTLPTSHFIQWRGAELHYTDEGQGIPVIMVHGYGGSHRNWQKLNDSLKGQYRVIRLDLPGFGLSDLPGVKEQKVDFLQLYSDYFAFMLDTLHVDSVYMIGNSMGGMMAWNAALQHSDKIKKLVLISSAGYDLQKVARDLSWAMNIPSLDFLFDKGLPLAVYRGSSEKIYYDLTKINEVERCNNCKLWNREGNLNAAYRLMRSGQYPDTSKIQDIAIPTLIVWGKNDKIVPVEHAQRYLRDIKGSRALILDSCGHIPMIERPTETASAIRNFLAE